MDSLTQIVLGAAAGEVVLGKKVGNRAMLWGAIAGTIPDLDTLVGNLFMSEIDALAFHRGISHSLLFSLLGALLFGWIVQQIYKSNYHKEIGISARTVFFGGITIAMFYFSKSTQASLVCLAISLVISGGLFLFLKRRYFSQNSYQVNNTITRDWQWLFFWSLVTHPILDSFTVYGTQLFAPFSDYRVAFNNISVADPFYTLPFLICLIVASFLHRSSIQRRWWNYAGIIISSMYMLFTLINKSQVNQVIKSTIKEDGLVANKYMTNPSILNNFLWSATVETDSFYYQGLYSIFDTDKKFKLAQIPKNRHLAIDSGNDRVLNILKWFSNDYYAYIIREDGKLQFNDMRYGTFRGEGNSENDYIFRFVLDESDAGYSLDEAEGGPPEGSEDQMMKDLFNRVKGI